MSQEELGEIQLGRDVEILNGKTYWYRPFDAVEEFTKKWVSNRRYG